MKNILSLFKHDLRRLFSNVMSVIIAIGLVIIPSIFAWYNIIACWNVFDNTGNLTVAVANSDEGYESDLMPLRVNVGDQVVSALRANDQINWTFTDESDAIDGVEAGRYYAAVVIPASFSRDMLSFYEDDMQHAELAYYSNEKKNAVAPRIIGQGADTVAYQVNETFAKTLAEVALSLASSLSEYADSSNLDGRIAALADHIDAAAGRIDQAGEVMSLYGSLFASAGGLAESSADLVRAARGEAGELTPQLSEGVTGLKDAASGVTASAGQIADALDAAKESLSQTADVASGVLDDVGAAATGASEKLRGQAEAVGGQASSLDDMAGKIEALVPSLPEASQAAAQATASSLRQAAGLLGDLQAQLTQTADDVDAGVAQGEAGRQETAQLAEQAQQSIDDIKTAYEQDLLPSLAALADEAGSLAAQVGSGMDALGGAADDLTGSAGSVAGMLGEAQQAATSAAEGLAGSGDRLRQLADDLRAALASGDDAQLQKILGSDTETLASALAAPVAVERTAVYPVENFGSAMAPLYTALALFIGSLLLLVAVRPVPSSRALADLPDSVRPSELFLGRFGVVAVLSLAQTTLMALGNMFFLGVQVVHPLLYLLCFWVSGLVFAFVIYTLVSTFANLGKAIAVLMLIVQVTGCGGSYPLQMMPGFVQALSPWLPATHVVAAMRAAMMGVYQNDFWTEMGMLLLFLVPALILGLVLRRPLARLMSWYVEKVEKSKLVS